MSESYDPRDYAEPVLPPGRLSDRPYARWRKLDDGRYTLRAYSPDTGCRTYLHVDHVIPRARGGAVDHIDNLQTLCEPCNLSKGCS